jgi:hypothetical protein
MAEFNIETTVTAPDKVEVKLVRADYYETSNIFRTCFEFALAVTSALLDKFLKSLSFRIHDRDLILYMRGSFDLDHNNKNSNIKTLDYIFSIILIVALFALPAFYGI